MKKILKYSRENQLWIQGLILWGIALSNYSSLLFWVFVIPAIIATGMQEILDEIRKLTNNDTESKS
jgi:hypothetical protein